MLPRRTLGTAWEAGLAQAQEWLSLNEAGQLIDGAAGWRVDAEGRRPSAEALLIYAQRGRIAVTARQWSVTKARDVDRSYPPAEAADAVSKAEFLLMLFAREKAKEEQSHTAFPSNVSLNTAFQLADERLGNFEAIRAIYDHSTGSFRMSWHSVTGLKFSLAHIRQVFAPSGPAAPRKGRPLRSGGWAIQDAPLIERMRQLMSNNPGMTAHAAALHFADEASGGASIERKQRRLSDRYRETFPD